MAGRFKGDRRARRPSSEHRTAATHRSHHSEPPIGLPVHTPPTHGKIAAVGSHF